jgi:hypothetical protein
LAKSKLKIFVAVTVVLSLLLPGQALASSTDPPPEFGPLTVFDPDFKYLDDGSGNLSYLGDEMVSVWGQTLGTRKVDTIGVQVTLQRWTGSEWIDVNTGPKSTINEASYAYTSREVRVSTGYYYRVKSRHWIEYGDVKEEGIRYSNSLLIN